MNVLHFSLPRMFSSSLKSFCPIVMLMLCFMRALYEYIEIPMEEYERLQQAIRDVGTGFLSVDDFIDQQVRSLLEKHAVWTKQKEDCEKR